jgi:hypothetical protein
VALGLVPPMEDFARHYTRRHHLVYGIGHGALILACQELEDAAKLVFP